MTLRMAVVKGGDDDYKNNKDGDINDDDNR